MESKKFNLFAMFMIVFMGAFCVFMGLKDSKGEDGKHGKSAYELAVEQGLFNGSELEYLQSLQGQDGSNITIEDVYHAYLTENSFTENDCSLADFISVYYPNTLLDEKTEKALVEFATAQALRSTVDIAYSCYMNSAIINATPSTLDNNDKVFLLQQTNQSAIGLSAGSGVIYQVNDNTAYIITNYHVVYVSNYSNDSSYKVYYNDSTKEYFTAKHNKSDEFSVSGNFGFSTYTAVNVDDVEIAPTKTHFLDNYEVYLYGYQAEGYGLSASFVGGSPENDIAILKIDKNSTNPNNKRIFTEDYKKATIANSAELAVGESVIAVGNPLLANTSEVDTSSSTTVEEYVNAYKKSYIEALCLTATDGVVSNTSEYQTFGSLLYGGKDSKMRLIRVSSAINAGNSGGGLFDINGHLIGIVNGKIASSDYDNVGYAIPINKAKAIADKVIAECGGVLSDVNIKIIDDEKLGLTLKTVKDGTKAPYYDETTLSWVNKNSVQVSEILATSKPALAGLKTGDLITSIVIGDKEYEIYNDYEFDDVLLSVKTTEEQITFKILTNSSGNLTADEITISLSQTDFVELI